MRKSALLCVLLLSTSSIQSNYFTEHVTPATKFLTCYFAGIAYFGVGNYTIHKASTENIPALLFLHSVWSGFNSLMIYAYCDKHTDLFVGTSLLLQGIFALALLADEQHQKRNN